MDGVKKDVKEIEKQINKLSLYKKEEDLNIEDISNIFSYLSFDYQSNNKDMLVEKQEEIMNNLKKINTIHNDSINKLREEISNTTEVVDKIKRDFGKIGEYHG